MTFTRNDAARLLAFIASGDQRTVGETDIIFWFAAARDGAWPSLLFAAHAVVRHFNNAPDTRLKPGHITGQLRELRRESARTFDPAIPPPGLDDEDLVAWQRRCAAEHLETTMRVYYGALPLSQEQMRALTMPGAR